MGDARVLFPPEYIIVSVNAIRVEYAHVYNYFRPDENPDGTNVVFSEIEFNNIRSFNRTTKKSNTTRIAGHIIVLSQKGVPITLMTIPLMFFGIFCTLF